MDLIAHKISHTTPKVVIDGKVYIAIDRLKINDGDKIRLIFESKNSTHPQGVAFVIDKNILLESGEKAKAWAFWWDGANRYIDIECITKKGELHVNNMWRDEKGFDVEQLGGGAMRVEALPDGSRRYHCNDGDLDNDFDDFVFRLVLLSGKKLISLVTK